MMKKPIVIERDVTLADAAKLMVKHSISSLLVLFDNKIAGIITYEDLVRHFGEQKKVSEVMTRQVITVKSFEKVQVIIDLISEKHISTVPVVDRAGKLVGVVHMKDIITEVCTNDEFLME